jgi:hypothetical protein
VRKAVVAAVAMIALIGAGVAAIPLLQDYAAGRIKAELERDGSIQVGSVKVDFLERGVVLHDMTAGFNGEFKVDNWEMTGLAWPLGELLRGRTPLGGLNWGDPLRVGHTHLQNVRIGDVEGGGGTWTIGELAAEGLDLPRHDTVSEGPYRSQINTARLLAALSVQRLEGTGIAYASPDDTAFAAASLVIEGYERGLIGRLGISGFQSKAANARAPVFSIADIEAGGIDLRRLVETVSSADWEPGTPVGRIPTAKASLSGFGGELLTRYGVSLDTVATETVRETANLSRSRLRVEGFVFAPSLRSVEALGMRMVLQAMNLNEVRLSFECGGTDDRARQEVTVDGCALSGPGLGDISFSARVADADEEFWRAVDDGDTFALLGSKAVLTSAKLVIADKSLLQRSLQAMAMMSGQPVASERTALAMEIRRYQPPDVLITQDMTKVLDTVARFVEEGGTLTIDAAPQPPFGLEKLEYLSKPGADLVNALGLTATLSR